MESGQEVSVHARCRGNYHPALHNRMNHNEEEQRILSGRLESLVDTCARNIRMRTEESRTVLRLPVIVQRTLDR